MSDSATVKPEPDPATVTADPVYVDDRELARRTPLSRATWQKFRRTGGGPPYAKCGGRIIYAWADVQAWIASRKVAP